MLDRADGTFPSFTNRKLIHKQFPLLPVPIQDARITLQTVGMGYISSWMTTDSKEYTLIQNELWQSIHNMPFFSPPDFSTYADMDLWRQIESVAKNRWVGAYWQSNGLTVIPTISWSTPRSFDFCFDGVEQNAIVAVSTLGCRRSKLSFLRGYGAMLNKLTPKTIICFGEPLPEMHENIVFVDYRASRKVVR